MASNIFATKPNPGVLQNDPNARSNDARPINR